MRSLKQKIAVRFFSAIATGIFMLFAVGGSFAYAYGGGVFLLPAKATKAESNTKETSITKALTSNIVDEDETEGAFEVEAGKSAEVPKGGVLSKITRFLGGGGVSIEVDAGTEVEGADPTGGSVAPPTSLSIVTELLDKLAASTGLSLGSKSKVLGGVDINSNSPVKFKKPVMVTAPVASCPANGVRVLHVADNGDESWIDATCSKGVVTFYTSSFSKFIIVENEAGAALTVFTDLKGHWSEAFVADLKAKGVVSGKTATTFAPDDKLTRAELTKIAMNAFGIKAEGESSFKDVAAGDWFASYVAGAKAAGIVGGYEDGTFKPNAAVTRAEALKILLAASKMDVSGAKASSFTDVKADAWYAMYVNYAADAKMVSGYADGSFGVNKAITRGEIAKMASVMMNK